MPKSLSTAVPDCSRVYSGESKVVSGKEGDNVDLWPFSSRWLRNTSSSLAISSTRLSRACQRSCDQDPGWVRRLTFVQACGEMWNRRRIADCVPGIWYMGRGISLSNHNGAAAIRYVRQSGRGRRTLTCLHSVHVLTGRWTDLLSGFPPMADMLQRRATHWSRGGGCYGRGRAAMPMALSSTRLATGAGSVALMHSEEATALDQAWQAGSLGSSAAATTVP